MRGQFSLRFAQQPNRDLGEGKFTGIVARMTGVSGAICRSAYGY